MKMVWGVMGSLISLPNPFKDYSYAVNVHYVPTQSDLGTILQCYLDINMVSIHKPHRLKSTHPDTVSYIAHRC